MLDFGLFTVPLLTAGFVFLAAMFTGDNIAIDNVRVLNSLDAASHPETVLTRELTDQLRALNETALSEAPEIVSTSTSTDKSLYEFQEYLNLTTVVSSARDLLGITPYYVSSEVTTLGGQAVFTARIYSRDRDAPVEEIRITGSAEKLEPILSEAALQILTRIDPLVVALYFYRQELANKEFEFRRTRELIASSLTTSPRWKSYLTYELIGRMHLTRAKLATDLNDAQRQTELDTARDYLQAALVQEPGFFLALRDLASVYADRHEYDLADRYFAEAVTIDPDDLASRQRWAEALSERGHVRSAIFQYVAAVELAPKNAELRDRLAKLYLKASRPDQARIQWQAAHAIDPLNREFTDRIEALAPASQ